MQHDTIVAIDREVAELEQEKAELAQREAELARRKVSVESAIEGLKEAKGRLAVLSGDSSAATPGQKTKVTIKLRPVAAKPPQGSNSERIVDFLKSAGAPQGIVEIAAGTGLERESVRRVLYRTSKKLFLREKVAGRGMVWSLKKSSDETHGTKKGDLAGLTIEEAARTILAERHNAPMHYKAICEEAARRGYESGRSEKVLPDSFHSMMDRKEDTFEKTGGGLFRLKQPDS